MRNFEIVRFDWKGALSWIVVILICLVAWFWFFSFEDCKSRECFNEALEKCSRARFIHGGDMIFEYMIKGEEKGMCEVNVKLLQGNLNRAESMKLEGQDMVCVLPLGVVMDPESNIGNCHGMLKEGLQDLVINKLHNYLVQNLGRLNLEMIDLPEVG